MNSIFRVALLLLFFLTGLAMLAFYWTFYKPLPDYSAVIEVPGTEANVDIHWDSFGVPHIYAQSESDLYYALGYVHAQDRLWQMTLSQITAEGRFAEFFGVEFIDYDKYQRTLGFWETAGRIEQEAPPGIQRILETYSRGVNDFIELNRRNLPIEFTLLDIQPILWTPTHSYALSRLISWEMNNSWWNEITYSWLAENQPPEVMQELFPVYETAGAANGNDPLVEILTEQALSMIDTEFSLRSLTKREGTSVGSNAWAVDGSRTESGLPLLAGDPHMGLWMPGNWYEVHLFLNGKNVSGATIPGAPVVVLGQNDNSAWSLTNMMADDTDFFMEKIVPEDPDLFVADSSDGVHEPFEWRDEILKVKDGDDRLYRVRSTRHGPVISDIHPAGRLMEDYLISMKWTGHEVSHELWSLYGINWSESFDEFTESLEHFRFPGQNFAYADQQGNIAVMSAAHLPVRDYSPILYRNGWDPSYDWKEWIPFDELPRVINPESGYVANANNKLHPDSYPHYIATFWEPPSRIQRIEELLDGQNPVTEEMFQQMQFDSYSVHARELVELIHPILRIADDQIDFAVAAPYLENWDFRYEAGSTAATILDTFFIILLQNTLADELGEEAFQYFMRLNNIPVQVMNRLLQENSFLFDDIATDTAESRNDIIVRSMQETIDWLREEYGEEPFQWRWENLHTVTLRPPLFAEASDAEDAPGYLKLIVNNLLSKGPYPAPGHAMSLNKGQYELLNPFRMVLGPSIRRVIDLSSPGKSHSILPTGQSGNPLSEFFGDQTDLWLSGQYRYMYQDSTFFQEVSYQTMQLIPSP